MPVFDRVAQVQAQEVTGEIKSPQTVARSGSADSKPATTDSIKPTFTSVRPSPSIEQNLPTGDYPPVQLTPAAPAVENDPYADLDFGDFEAVEAPAATAAVTPPSADVASPSPSPSAGLEWSGPTSNVPSVDFSPSTATAHEPSSSSSPSTAPAEAPWGGPVEAEAPVAPAPTVSTAPDASPASTASPAPASALAETPVEPAPAPAAVAAPSVAEPTSWGNLDSIPTPKGAPAESAAWGKLDDIPTPAAAGGAAPRGGLGASMMGKARAGAGAGLLKNRLGSTPPPPSQTAPPAPPAEPAAVLDDAAAQKKLDQLMSSSNETSDYIFATGGLDARMLGRIDGWVSQIEAKDKYADGHARQVAEISCAIAKELGLDQDAINTIRQAALVHDLGKLGAAAQILQKAEDDLSDTELLLVMNHPMDGAELLESFPDLQHLAPIVRAHHEEFDGNGFPHGLKGDEIPLAARIIGLANRYHEQASPKRSGPGKDPSSVQSEFVENAGKGWDPNVVQAFIQAVLTGKIPSKF